MTMDHECTPALGTPMPHHNEKKPAIGTWIWYNLASDRLDFVICGSENAEVHYLDIHLSGDFAS